MDDITKARHNFVLAFQYCWNGTDFPVFRDLSVYENGGIHTGFFAIDLLDKALKLHSDFQEARDLRADIWHAILTNNREEHYDKYLNSKAWKEIRKKCFAHFGCKCLFCDNDAKEVHHRNYANIGKENVLTDLSVLCNDCHNRFHDIARNYWRKFKTYVEAKGNHLKLFPNPDWNAIYNIQIDPKISTAADIRKNADAFWLVAYRDTQRLEANLCVKSLTHYRFLKGQKKEIDGEIDDNLGELIWVDDANRIGFLKKNVGNVRGADTDQEFSWLHDRLLSLQKVFRPRIAKIQAQGN